MNQSFEKQLSNEELLGLFAKDFHLSNNQINEILSTHMPQFKKSNVLKCYDVLLKKYLDDNRPSKIQ
jgi:hypothetical protein